MALDVLDNSNLRVLDYQSKVNHNRKRNRKKKMTIKIKILKAPPEFSKLWEAEDAIHFALPTGAVVETEGEQNGNAVGQVLTIFNCTDGDLFVINEIGFTFEKIPDRDLQ